MLERREPKTRMWGRVQKLERPAPRTGIGGPGTRDSTKGSSAEDGTGAQDRLCGDWGAACVETGGSPTHPRDWIGGATCRG